MSHYSVAVFSKENGYDVDELLAPYDENIVVDRYVFYTKDELIKKGRDRIQTIRDSSYSEFLSNPDEYLKKYCSNDPNNDHYRFLRDEFPKRLLWSDEEIYLHEIDGFEADEVGDDGEVYSTYNPQSKWDWYEIGGRFSGMLKKKEKCCRAVDQAYAIDVDFDGMKADAIKALVPYEKFMNSDSLWSKEYLKERYPDEKTYVARETVFSTYAVVAPDGTWHAPGEMGWWAMSSETGDEIIAWDLGYYEHFIKPAIENNWHITIVDCHI